MPRRTSLRRLLILGFVAIVTPLALAKPGVVKTKDGRTIEGDVNERGDGTVVVTTKAGLGVTLQATQVGSISYADDIQAAYQQRVAALPANATAKDHVDLARWAFENRAYDLARKELDKAQSKDPNSSDAAQLRQMVDRSASWDRSKPATGTGAASRPAPGANTNPNPGAPAAGHGAAQKNLLTPDQINVIKQHELQANDTQVRIRFEHDVMRKIAPLANMTPQQIQALPDAEKMLLVFERGEPAMRNDIRILNDPASLLRFKQRIQPVLMQGCAATNCHGPTHHGKFVLNNPPGGDPGTYTNFYILSQYQVTGSDGTIVGRLVDRTRPVRSLFLQMGLPLAVAEIDHPEVQGFQPTFRALNDPRYLEVLDWIQNSLVTVDPNYGIDFKIPGQPAQAARPAAPAPAPAAQPQTPQQNPPAQRPGTGNQQQPPPAQGGNSTEDALKATRERMRPIRGF